MLITLGPLHHFPRDGCLIVLHCIHSCLVVDQCINDIRYLAWMHLNTLYVELACPASTCGRLWPLSRWNLCGVTTSSMPQKGLHVLVRSWRCGRIPFLDVLQLFCSYFNVTLFCHCPPFADLRLSCLKQTNILRILEILEHFRASWQGCTACPSRWLDAQFPETRAVHCCELGSLMWMEVMHWILSFWHFDFWDLTTASTILHTSPWLSRSCVTTCLVRPSAMLYLVFGLADKHSRFVVTLSCIVSDVFLVFYK